MTQDVPSPDWWRLVSAQVQRHALAPLRDLYRFVVDLETANAKQMITGQAADVVADSNLSADRGSGHDQTVPLKDEHAVDGQPEIPVTATPRMAFQALDDEPA